MSQTLALLKIRTREYFGINKALRSKDRKERRKLVGTALVYAFMVIYFSGMTFGLAMLLIGTGLGDKVPGAAAGLVFVTGLISASQKSYSDLFDPVGFRREIVLPVTPDAMIAARFLSIWLYELLTSVPLFWPMMIPFVLFVAATPVAILSALLLFLMLPALPAALGACVGLGLAFGSSALKRKQGIKSFFQAAGVLLAAGVGMSFSFLFSGAESEASVANTLSLIRKIHPMSSWISAGMTEGSILGFALFALVSAAAFAAVWLAMRRFYIPLCNALGEKSSYGNYKVESLSASAGFRGRFFRELKRFLSSGIYVANMGFGYLILIVGGILAAVFARDNLIPIFREAPIMERALPFVVAGTACLAPTTCVSLSMEGKTLWILKTLPLSMKDIALPKIALNLVMAVPSCLIASAALALSLPLSLPVLFALIAIPLAQSVLCSVMGLRINFARPMLDWDRESVPVKQSASVIWTMLANWACGLPAVILFFLVPDGWLAVAALLVPLLYVGAAFLLYRSILRIDLRRIGN